MEAPEPLTEEVQTVISNSTQSGEQVLESYESLQNNPDDHAEWMQFVLDFERWVQEL
ncbi:hypothetical protein JCM19037_1493 [Geomicrobium sp. JCM 19037]|uniref:hypothetical protein n=1 Tax=Geomicrobium sp. JCM 19037 TaxID=1460634 RepID=UPI00045F1E5E|nr:hypothetical protein [Geomicrobium sp. JCM 19037]GAK03194.1 hypothetical protein JCM19037_1493 [Geomicrobium sp. JCM 19037]